MSDRRGGRRGVSVSFASGCMYRWLWVKLEYFGGLWCFGSGSQGAGEPETARVYQEFLKTFQPEDPSADKTFIRGDLLTCLPGFRAFGVGVLLRAAGAGSHAYGIVVIG